MAQKTQAELDEEDGFIRGYHDIPDDHVLRAMSNISLYDALASAKPGTTAHMVIEAEKRRREVLPIATSSVTADPANSPNNPMDTRFKASTEPVVKSPEDNPSWDNTWYGKVAIGLAIFFIGYLLTHLG
jgi:hypothetical protein